MRRSLFLAGIFLSTFLGCVIPLAAQTAARAKHPFTFEDMMTLKRVEEPDVSPDGKWVLFAAVDVALKANTKTPHVWVVPLNTRSLDWRMIRKRIIGPLGRTGSERKKSFRSRMLTGRAGRRMASALRLSLPKKADRRYGLRISMARRGR